MILTAKYLTVFLGTLLLLPLLARMAVRIGLVDYPGRRKRHRGAVPLIGGPAIFAGVGLGALVMVEPLRPYGALFAAMGILLVAGILDDLRDLSARQKFVAQLLAVATMVTWGKIVITNLGDLTGLGNLVLLRWGLPFTVVALIGLINAINMSDGADGLASGLSLIALLLLAFSALIVGRIPSARMLLLTVAAVAAFWTLNMRFPWQSRARFFLGDSGSMLIGLVLTWFSVEVTRGTDGLAPIAAVWFLALPLLDMGVVIMRRLGKGRSPFQAGRDHFHHVLLAAGMTPTTTVLTIHGIALALGAFGFFSWRAGVPDFWLFYAFLAVLGVSYFMSFRWLRVIRLLRRRRIRRNSRRTRGAIREN